MAEFKIIADMAGQIATVDVPEDTTAADFAISVDGDFLTRNRVGTRSRLLTMSESVFGPVAGIVDWLIENWGPLLWETQTPFKKSGVSDQNSKRPAIPGYKEVANNWEGYFDNDIHEDDVFQFLIAHDLRSTVPYTHLDRERQAVAFAEWQHRHMLGHACSDLALPSIVLFPEDQNIVVAVDGLPKTARASVQFLSPDETPRSASLFVIPKSIFEKETRSFINKVLERAQANQKFRYWADWLKERWVKAQNEEAQPGRRLHWMLGDVSASAITNLRTERPEVATALEHLLLDCRIVTRKTELRPVEQVVGSLATEDGAPRSADQVMGWQSISTKSFSMNQPDFIQGYQLAREVRKAMDLNDRPIGDLTKFLEPWDVRLEDGCETLLFRAAVCASRGKTAHIVPSSLAPRMAGVAGYRFGVASAFGRLLWQSNIGRQDRVYAAQGENAMLSQSRRANAFAAELLLPIDAIAGLGSNENELWKLSEIYGISRVAARWHWKHVGGRVDQMAD